MKQIGVSMSHSVAKSRDVSETLPDHTGNPARPEQADVGDVDGPVAVPQRRSEVVCHRGIYHLLRNVLDLGAVASDDNLYEFGRRDQLSVSA